MAANLAASEAYYGVLDQNQLAKRVFHDLDDDELSSPPLNWAAGEEMICGARLQSVSRTVVVVKKLYC